VVSAMGYAATEDGRACWQVYHLIGDALRQGEPLAGQGGAALLPRLRERMAQEGVAPRLAPASLQQVAQPLDARVPGAVDPAANAEVLRWKLAAGFASLAAVAVLGW